MISKRSRIIISLFYLILSLKLTCCSDIKHDDKLSNNKTFHQKYGSESYIYFDMFMLNFVNSFKARLESNQNEMTPIEERTFFHVFIKLLQIRREMEAHLLENAWYLRRGR
jgi:hypothetical protein